MLLTTDDNATDGSNCYGWLGFADTQRLVICLVVNGGWLDEGFAVEEGVTRVEFKLVEGIIVVVLELTGYWVLKSIVKVFNDCDGGLWILW